jgi:hypothetical protein
MCDLLESLVWGVKSRQYCVVEGSLQMVSKPLPILRWRERAKAHEGHQKALTGTLRME